VSNAISAPNQAQKETARRALDALIDKYQKMSEAERREITEAGVVRQFIDPLLRDVLGYPIEDPKRYSYELHTSSGRPDITLTMPDEQKLYIEAKRFGIIKNLDIDRNKLDGVYKPQELALTSVGKADRTREEQQAINYAFSNGATWAILTNFEKLRLFNARRDWLVLSFETVHSYRDEFDQLWQLSYHNLAQGSLGALSNQRWTTDIDKAYLSFINDMREKLALDLWRNRANNPWLHTAEGGVNVARLREVVQRFLDRMVVVRFAEDHLVLPAGQLRQLYETFRDSLYTFSLGEFVNKMFRVFDAKHNSALFALDTVDQAHFSDEVLANLVNKLYEVRYRSMTADILGNTYEEYLGKTLHLDGQTIVVRSNLETRKKQGTYYTPTPLVHYLVDTTLGRYLYATHDGTPDGQALEGESPRSVTDISRLRVLDAACGSGSFLIYAYQVLAGFYQREIKRITSEIETTQLDLLRANASPLDINLAIAPLKVTLERLADYPRLILEQHLYGVDLDPQASELAAVNLILRALERQDKKQRLPLILDQSIKTGNGLVGMRADDPRLQAHHADLGRMVALRRELRETSHLDPRHDHILHELADVRQRIMASVAYDEYFSDVARVRPFHWGVEFPEVFFDEEGKPLPDGGFTVVIGNPPWEVVKPDLREFYAQYDDLIESKYSREQVERRIEELNTQDPTRPQQYAETTRSIEESAVYFRKAKAFLHQGSGDTATHKLFTERAFGLLATGGRLGYLIPSGIYTDLGTKPLRELLMTHGRIDYIYSFSNERYFFADVDHRFKFTLIGARKGVTGDRFSAAFRFNPRVAIAPDDLRAFLNNRENLIEMDYATIKRFSPDSLSIMEFQSKRDYAIADKIYAQHPLLGEHLPDTWNVKFTRELDMTNDRDLFYTQPSEGRVPLYEGKMIHQFNPYFAEPQYWVNVQQTAERLKNKTGEAYKGYRLAVRAIASTTNERTLIASLLPVNTFCGNSGLVNLLEVSHEDNFYIIGVLNSYVVDYILRQKMTANVNMFYLYQLPIPRLKADNPRFGAIVARSAKLTCYDAQGKVREGFGEMEKHLTLPSPKIGEGSEGREGSETPLSIAKRDGEGLGGEVNSPHTTTPLSQEGLGGEVNDAHKKHLTLPSPKIGEGSEGREVTLRAELDALIAHLYGLSENDLVHILSTFPLVDENTKIAVQNAYRDVARGVVK
jgi:hypothetical protein